jgi:large subunit ribosomal protein L18
MLSELKQRNVRRKRRKLSMKKRVRGCADRPRMAVFKSNRNLSVQLIDDDKGHTLASASTLMKELDKTEFKKKGKVSARYLGEWIAKLAKEQNIESVVFDRGHFKYHGLLAELANSAREAGLRF